MSKKYSSYYLVVARKHGFTIKFTRNQMTQNIHVILNEPATTAQIEKLADTIIAWLDGQGLTALIVVGDEPEEATNVPEK